MNGRRGIAGALPRRWRYRAAPFWRRVLADSFDLALMAAAGWGLWRSGLIAEPLPAGPGDLLDRAADLAADDAVLLLPAAVAWFTVVLIYGALARAAFAGTLGERLFGLRLLDPTGAPAGPARACLHGLAQLLALAPLGLGYTWALVDRERRTLAEHLTGTRLSVGPPELETRA